MKLVEVLAVLTAFTALAEAVHHHGPHGHRHFHDKKRAIQVVNVPGPTVVSYEFDGKAVSKEDVCKGIADGSYVWGPGGDHSTDCSAPAPAPVPAPVPAAPAPVPSQAAPAPAADAGKSKAGGQHLEQPEAPKPSPKETAQDATDDATDYVSGLVGGLTGYDKMIAANPNTDKDFPDGKVSCGTFPRAYGAIPIDWQKLGGWAGIQYVTIDGGYARDADTAIPGEKCEERPGKTTFCSYSCPPGYQKSQWPAEQGPEGHAISVGGIKCENGKLWLTNPDLSNKLCIKGTGQVKVQNDMKKNSAICRTDYPGDESQTVPLNTQPGQNHPLTCPESKNYYQWLDKPTTAQYYVNMKGISVDQACQWSTDGSYKGNWAPINFGVGQDVYGKTWLSITSTKQNNPVSWKDLDYNVEIKGELGGPCFYVYKNGKGYYCSKGSLSNYDLGSCQTQETNLVPGCTAQLMSGEATYVLSDA